MFKCSFSKLIYKDSKMKQPGCYVSREADIPFVPFVGLDIWLDGRPYPEKIAKVSYSIAANKFSCEIEANAPGSGNTYEGFKNSYLNDGWSSNGDME